VDGDASTVPAALHLFTSLSNTDTISWDRRKRANVGTASDVGGRALSPKPGPAQPI
jgi:hypothetical protein